MKLLAITAGAANMYCGSCLRDNALAAELKAQGHDVTLLPLYTPTLTDEPNVSTSASFSAVSAYTWSSTSRPSLDAGVARTGSGIPDGVASRVAPLDRGQPAASW